jgi:hypothetical protein
MNASDALADATHGPAGAPHPLSAHAGTQGRGWAYTGAILGITVSVTANIAHALIPTHPHAGAVLFAALWPLFLFVTIEIMARTPWPNLHRWKWVRFGGLSVVAVVAAVVSYRHQAGLLAFYGEDGLTTVIGPLAVDGLLLTATGALIATSRTRHTAAPATAVTPATAPASAAAPVTTPVTPAKTTPDTRSTATPRPAAAGPVTPDMTRAYAATHPEMTRDQQAAALGISARTLARHLAKPTKLTAIREA